MFNRKTIKIDEELPNEIDIPKRPSQVEDAAIAYAREVARNRASSGFQLVQKIRSSLFGITPNTVTPIKKGRVIFEQRFPKAFRGVFSACFHPKEETFVIGYGSGAIQIYFLENPENGITVKESSDYGVPITAIKFLPQPCLSNFFAAGACGFIYNCAMQEKAYRVFAREEHNEINAIDISNCGHMLVTGGKDTCVRLYDIETIKFIGSFPKTNSGVDLDANEKFHKMRIFSVKCHPVSSEIFVSGGWDDCVKVWDIRVKDGFVLNIYGPHICGDSIDIKNDTILTGSWVLTESLQMWDLRVGRLIQSITPTNRPPTVEGEFLYCAKFLNVDTLGNLVASGGSGVGSVEIINVDKQKVVATFKVYKSIQSLDVKHRRILFAGMESTVKLGEI